MVIHSDFVVTISTNPSYPEAELLETAAPVAGKGFFPKDACESLLLGQREDPSMKTNRPPCADWHRSLFLPGVLAIVPGVALANGDPPPNAQAKPYGSVWECDRG